MKFLSSIHLQPLIQEVDKEVDMMLKKANPLMNYFRMSHFCSFVSINAIFSTESMISEIISMICDFPFSSKDQ